MTSVGTGRPYRGGFCEVGQVNAPVVELCGVPLELEGLPVPLAHRAVVEDRVGSELVGCDVAGDNDAVAVVLEVVGEDLRGCGHLTRGGYALAS